MKDCILNNGISLLAVPELAATGFPVWDEAFAAFIAADALQRADFAFGLYRDALDDAEKLEHRLNKEHGPRRYIGDQLSYGNAEADAAWREDFEIVSGVELDRDERLLRPMWNASYALLHAPAPTLQAALFKIELIQREELHLDGDACGDPMEIIRADLERLRQSQPDPVTRYWSAFDSYNAAGYDKNGDPLGGPEYQTALAELDRWSPPTAYDFIRKYEAMHYDGGFPNEERRAMLERDAVSILGNRSRRAQPVEA